MAKNFRLQRLSTAVLRRRKKGLLAHLVVPADAVRASCIQQYLTCGKDNCRCQRGHKHGPFVYLVQCVDSGNPRKFLLKTDAQKQQARTAVTAYTGFQDRLEELSQLNTELLRRGETLAT